MADRTYRRGWFQTVFRMAVAAIVAPYGVFDTARAQGALLTFDVASVKPALVTAASQVQIDPATLMMVNVSLYDVVKWAYDVGDYQFTAPDWFKSARFDITAKTAKAAGRSEMKKMMQALLAERFQLKIHQDTRELSVYVLRLHTQGHKLREANGSGDTSFRMTQAPNGWPICRLAC